mmetsp:Transcript_8277/g.24408  ORF Transcript_8277/g.24408 Transcript_8277/m.24408 type:complete len:202 (-) Transcript_8277:892-1497(-)
MILLLELVLRVRALLGTVRAAAAVPVVGRLPAPLGALLLCVDCDPAALIEMSEVVKHRKLLPELSVQPDSCLLLLFALLPGAQHADGARLLELLPGAQQRHLLGVPPRVLPAVNNRREEHAEDEGEHDLEDHEDGDKLHRGPLHELPAIKAAHKVEEKLYEGIPDCIKLWVPDPIEGEEHEDKAEQHDQEDQCHDYELVDR